MRMPVPPRFPLSTALLVLVGGLMAAPPSVVGDGPTFLPSVKHRAFRRGPGVQASPERLGEGKRVVDNRRLGISVYRIGRKGRRAAAPPGHHEIPCYRTNGGGWLVPTATVIVQARPGVSRAAALEFLRSLPARAVAADPRVDRRFYVHVPSAAEALPVSEQCAKSPLVAWAQVDWLQPVLSRGLPNDTSFSDQWYLHNTGLMPNRDVYAEPAWSVTWGSSDIVIAVLDDGFDMTHEDLTNNVYLNPGESGSGWETDGLDNDANGYIDDWRGWDFADPDTANNPSPGGAPNVHGTASAGLACATTGNAKGIASPGGGCRFLPIRIVDDLQQSTTASNLVAAFEYAVAMADVVTIGYWLNPIANPGIVAAIRDGLVTGRGGRGSLVFIAMGNDGVQVRYRLDMAALPEVVGVTSTTEYDRRAWFGNYGPALGLAAPGGGGRQAILTTDRTFGGYGGTLYTTDFGRTSASAPLAASVAALVRSVGTPCTALQLRRRLEAGADPVDARGWPYGTAGRNNHYGAGRINAWKALLQAASDTPLYDTYEPDDTTNNAASIADGALQYRSMTDGGDLDWIAFTLSDTNEIRLTVMGTTGTVLRLYDNAATLLANDAGGCPELSMIETTLPGGSYYARVESGTGGAVSNYGLHLAALNVRDSYEPDNTTNTAGTMVTRTMEYRSLWPSGDVDSAQFRLLSPSTVDLWTMGDPEGDTIMLLRDMTGGLLASNDDQSHLPYVEPTQDYYSQISTQLPAGVYYVEVYAYESAIVSSYQLLLETGAADAYEPGDDAWDNSPPQIKPGERLARSFDQTNDIDWSWFELTNAADVLILTDSANPNLVSSNVQTHLSLYSNATPLAVDDDFDNGKWLNESWPRFFSALYVTNLPVGTYHICVQATNMVTNCANYHVSLDVFERKTRIDALDASGSGFALTWEGEISMTYGIDVSSNLLVPQGWTRVTSGVEGVLGETTWTDDGSCTTPDPGSATSRYYRVVIE